MRATVLSEEGGRNVRIEDLDAPLTGILRARLVLDRAVSCVVNAYGSCLLTVQIMGARMYRNVTLRLDDSIRRAVLVIILRLDLCASVRRAVVLKTNVRVILTDQATRTPRILVLAP